MFDYIFVCKPNFGKYAEIRHSNAVLRHFLESYDVNFENKDCDSSTVKNMSIVDLATCH